MGVRAHTQSHNTGIVPVLNVTDLKYVASRGMLKLNTLVTIQPIIIMGYSKY